MASTSIEIMILGALIERPMSAYEMDKTLEERNVRRWIRISSPSVYRNVIRRGINKINYYTYMSYAGYAAAKAHAEANGSGFFHDMALCAQKAMEENALSTLHVFSGKQS